MRVYMHETCTYVLFFYYFNNPTITYCRNVLNTVLCTPFLYWMMKLKPPERDLVFGVHEPMVGRPPSFSSESVYQSVVWVTFFSREQARDALKRWPNKNKYSLLSLFLSSWMWYPVIKMIMQKCMSPPYHLLSLIFAISTHFKNEPSASFYSPCGCNTL